MRVIPLTEAQQTALRRCWERFQMQQRAIDKQWQALGEKEQAQVRASDSLGAAKTREEMSQFDIQRNQLLIQLHRNYRTVLTPEQQEVFDLAFPKLKP